MSEEEEEGEMWSSRYVAGGGCRGSGEGEARRAVQRGRRAVMLGRCWEAAGAPVCLEIRLQIPRHVDKPAGLGPACWFNKYKTGGPHPFFPLPRLIRWQ